MFRSVFILNLFALLLSSCYCIEQTRGKSSVRNLTVVRSKTLCDYRSDNGKSIPVTLYYGDPFYQKIDIRFHSNEHITSDLGYKSKGIIGLRMEKYVPLPFLPGPVLGLGLDYSHHNYSTEYYVIDHFQHYEKKNSVSQNRLLLSLNFITLVRYYSIGYFTLQGGKVWDNSSIEKDFMNAIGYEKEKTSKVDYRIGYGMQFLIRPTVALNLEIGYGGGAFFRGGISWWVF
jgi:hypothetical protein